MIFISIILAVVLLMSPVAGAIGVSENEPAPDFTLSSINGDIVSLNEYRGKTVVLVYWRTEHERSTLALKDVKSLVEELEGKDIQVLTVIADSGEKEKAAALLGKNSIEFPVLLDNKRKVYSSYGIRVYPSTVIIDEKGKVVHGIPSHALTYKKVLEGYLKKAIGEIDESELQDAITPHSKEKDKKTLEAQRLYNLAMKFTTSGLIDMAINTVKKSIDAKPAMIESHVLLGFLYLENREADAALETFRSALEINPQSNDAKTGLGGALVMKGDADAAIKILKTATVANPYAQMTYYELGKAYELKGERDKSIEMYKKAIEKIVHKQILPSSVSKCE